MQSDRKRATKKVVWGADKSGERRGRQVAAFFLDYNAVEGIFLACAILVNLAGVMFQADADAPSTVAGTVSIEATGTMWGIMFIISFSIAYFFVIVFTELAQAFEFDICAPCAKRQAAKQAAKAARLAAVKGGSVAAGTVKYDADAAAAHPGGGDDGLSIANPMFTKKTETPAPTGAVVPQVGMPCDALVSDGMLFPCVCVGGGSTCVHALSFYCMRTYRGYVTVRGQLCCYNVAVA